MPRPRLALLGLTLSVAALAPATASASDFARNILPPGQYGTGGSAPTTDPLTTHQKDQIPLYDALTPLKGNVTIADIVKDYKPEDFNPIGASQVEPTSYAGPGTLTIKRDSFGVPHIYGTTKAAAYYGVGWISAEDRSLLAQFGRKPAYAAVADVPGLNAFSLVTGGGGGYEPSAQAVALVHSEQGKLVKKYGAKGRAILSDLQVYADGINGYRKSINSPEPTWTVDDSLAVTAFIGSIFGNGGGDETRLDDFLVRLRHKLGVKNGSKAFTDLTEANDPEAPTTAYKRFPYGNGSATPTAGSPLIQQGSLQTKSPTSARRKLASNFLIVGKNRSATGENMAVMGPQLGYYDPEIVVEADVHAPGINAQGAYVPGGSPYMLLGRTKNYAWSLTTATNDNTDQFLEQLCGSGGRNSTHYLYKGKCIAMKPFDAGTIKGKAQKYFVTVHGPVQGTVIVKGKPYAIAKDRSDYGEDANSLAALRDMSIGAGSTVNGFYKAANEFEFTFNWAYVSRQHIAYFSSGKLPIRAKGTNKLLPTIGTGKYDWKGFLSLAKHPHQSDPKQGTFTNWNNKPAPGWQAGEDNLSYGSVHRVEDFYHFKKKNTIADVVSVMNKAATQDLPAVQIWPEITQVLDSGKAPSALAKKAENLVTAWEKKGAPRLDADLNGTYDDPGVAILDAAFTPMATRALGARIGGLTTELSDFMDVDSEPSFGSGWYGYVDKDLRTLLHRKVTGKFGLSYCGRGSLARCRSELWAGLNAAAKQLAAKQGSDPSKWRRDAIGERIHFIPGLISDTMRWTDRPTFQQVLRFAKK